MRRASKAMGIRMRHKQSGVSLIELLVVITIIGILSSIAYPSYRQYVLRGNRTEAKTAMMQVSQALEKCFTRFGAYDNANCTAYAQLAGGAGRLTDGGKYLLSFAAVDDVSFVIQAVPQDGQAQDTDCGTLAIDQTGKREARAVGADVNKCW